MEYNFNQSGKDLICDLSQKEFKFMLKYARNCWDYDKNLKLFFGFAGDMSYPKYINKQYFDPLDKKQVIYKRYLTSNKLIIYKGELTSKFINYIINNYNKCDWFK